MMVEVKTNEKWSKFIPADCEKYNGADLLNLESCEECNDNKILDNCKLLRQKYNDQIRHKYDILDPHYIPKRYYSQRKELGFLG